MRRLFCALPALLLALLFASPAAAQKGPRPPVDGPWLVYHPTAGYLMIEEHYKNGKPHGPSLRFDDTGLVHEAHYKDGKRVGFDRHYTKGKLIAETFYKDGVPDGATFHRGDEYEKEGQFRSGKPDGVWKEKRTGQWEMVRTYKDGQLHGVWERKDKDGKLLWRITFEKGKIVEQPDDVPGIPYFNKISKLTADGKDPLADLAMALLQADVDLDYPETPIAEVIEDLSDRFQAPMFVDSRAVPLTKEKPLPVTINENRTQLMTGLFEMARQHQLVFDYRFHSFWLTTPKALSDWKDSTGVSELNPAEGSPLAKALQQSPKFDILGIPLAGQAESFQKEYGIELDASRVKEATWSRKGLAGPRRAETLLLRDALFITLYQNNCHCRELDRKLVIEPHEAKAK